MSWVTKWLSDIISGKYLKGSYARAKKKSQKNNAAKTARKGSSSKKGQKNSTWIITSKCTRMIFSIDKSNSL